MPGDAERGIASFNRGDFAAALKSFERALAAGGDAATLKVFIAHARRSLSWEHTWKGKGSAAKECAAKALKADPGLDAFSSLMRSGKFSEAFAAGEAVLDAGATPDHLKGFWNPWGGVPVDAIRESMLKKLARLPESPWLFYYRAALREDEGKWEDYARARAYPKARYGWMLLKIGHGYLAAEKFEEAVSCLRSSLRQKPMLWWSHGFLAEALLCLGKPGAAVAEMRRARLAASSLDGPSVLAWQGEIFLWLGRYQEAFKVLEESCRKGFSLAYCWRGAAVLKMGDARRALEFLDEALKVLPDDREAHVWRAEAKLRLGLHREALAELDFTPAPFWALVIRALALAGLKDARGCRREFEKLPAAILDRVRVRPPWTPEAVLEAALTQARGFRREDYGQKIWTGVRGHA